MRPLKVNSHCAYLKSVFLHINFACSYDNIDISIINTNGVKITLILLLLLMQVELG